MDQATATLIAAIVTATGSTIVGALAVLFAWRQNLKTLVQQRQMALDERLSERRTNLYLEILQILHTDGGGRASSDRLGSLLPQVVAFASDEVQEHYDDVVQALASSPSAQQGVRAIGRNPDVAVKSFVWIIRSELQSPRVGVRRAPYPRRASE